MKAYCGILVTSVCSLFLVGCTTLTSAGPDPSSLLTPTVIKAETPKSDLGTGINELEKAVAAECSDKLPIFNEARNNDLHLITVGGLVVTGGVGIATAAGAAAVWTGTLTSVGALITGVGALYENNQDTDVVKAAVSAIHGRMDPYFLDAPTDTNLDPNYPITAQDLPALALDFASFCREENLFNSSPAAASKATSPAGATGAGTTGTGTTGSTGTNAGGTSKPAAKPAGT